MITPVETRQMRDGCRRRMRGRVETFHFILNRKENDSGKYIYASFIFINRVMESFRALLSIHFQTRNQDSDDCRIIRLSYLFSWFWRRVYRRTNNDNFGKKNLFLALFLKMKWWRGNKIELAIHLKWNKKKMVEIGVAYSIHAALATNVRGNENGNK